MREKGAVRLPHPHSKRTDAEMVNKESGELMSSQRAVV